MLFGRRAPRQVLDMMMHITMLVKHSAAGCCEEAQSIGNGSFFLGMFEEQPSLNYL